MRLETISTALAQRFQAISDADEAMRIFLGIFYACISKADDSIFSYLDNADMARGLRTGVLSEGFDFERHVASLDDKYFDAEEEGRNDDAAAYFTLARLFSALKFARSAVAPDEYAEAAYEAIMSLPEPQAFNFDG